MLRFILALTFLILFLVISQIIRFFLFLYEKIWSYPESKYRKDLISLRIVQWAFNVVLFISGVKLTVIGEKNVSRTRPMLYIGNHRSDFDIIISYARTPGLCGYVAKKEIEKVPLLRAWMRDLYCLFLDRGDPRQGMKTILTAIERVKRGISVAIYPEGTRYDKGVARLENKAEPMLAFHEGSFKIAAKTGCLIQPMVILHSEDVFEKQKPKIRPAKVTLVYDQPIDVGTLSAEELKGLGAMVRERMMKIYLEQQDHENNIKRR